MDQADTIRVQVALQYKTRSWQTIDVDLGPAKLDKLLSARGEVVRPVDWAGWQQIEKAEVAAATKPAPRRKFVRIDDMLPVLDKARATT